MRLQTKYVIYKYYSCNFTNNINQLALASAQWVSSVNGGIIHAFCHVDNLSTDKLRQCGHFLGY